VSNYTVLFDLQFLETSGVLLTPKFDGLESKLIQEPPPTGNKVVVGTSKNRLFLQQKSKQLNVTLLKEKLRLEILVKEKQLRDAKDLVIKDSVSYIQAGNVPLHDKSPLKLNENAPNTAIEHGASLTPYHVGGVLLAQIQDDKLYKLTDTVTANAPLQGISGPCTSVQVSHPNESPLLQMDTVPCTPIHITLLADSQAKQIETEPNHPITHGASISPGNVGGGLQTQTEADSAVKLTDTRSNDRAVDKAAQVGIDVHLPLIQEKKTVTVKAAADEEDVI
jgi:hypothetical protein